jgi:hypothetical protein
LLGQIAARARSPPGGDNDDCDSCHPAMLLNFRAWL